MPQLLVALLVCIATSAAYAHGGNYTGPGGGGMPGYDGPAGGPTPGPNPGPGGGPGGETGGDTPGGNTPGGGGPVGPVRPGAGPTGGNATRGGATGSPAVKKNTGPNVLGWDWWWDLNEERFLNLKHAVRSRDAGTTDADVFLGNTEGGESPAEVTARTIRNQILPALQNAVKDSFFDTRAAAVIALGKVGNSNQSELIALMKTAMTDKDERVQESACLGLGLLGSQSAVPFLLQVAKGDHKIAQETFGRSDILPRTRMWAAVAIGMIGHREAFSAEDDVVKELIRMAGQDGANQDLQIGPAIALQLLKIEDNIPELLRLCKNEKLDPFVRAHLVVGLGKIGAKSAVPDLLELLQDKNNHVARSAAIALGLVTDTSDAKTIQAIERVAKDGKEMGLRNFAMIALGEIGSESAKATLLGLLIRGKSEQDKTFPAIALGLMGFKHKSEALDGLVVATLVKQWKSAKSESERGALAIGLALLGSQEVLPEMREVLEAGGQQRLKGYVCTALGLLGDQAAKTKIRELVAQRGDPDLRRAAAIALGLLQDVQAVDVLKKVIQESASSKGILGAATVAMGFIGDRAAVPLLTGYVLKPDQHQDVTRAFAAVALGFLGDKDAIPMLSLIHENSNYLAQTNGLSELLTIL